MKEQLEEWRERYEFVEGAIFPELKVVYCVGSRFDNVVMGGKTKNPVKPKLPPQLQKFRNSELVRSPANLKTCF
jgi:hypothetical protein